MYFEGLIYTKWLVKGGNKVEGGLDVELVFLELTLQLSGTLGRVYKK